MKNNATTTCVVLVCLGVGLFALCGAKEHPRFTAEHAGTAEMKIINRIFSATSVTSAVEKLATNADAIDVTALKVTVNLAPQGSAEKVLYAELTPQEFRERIAAAPIAYLPLGTLEWHGEHLPLGSDGLQSYGFFIHLARSVGGIVLPMLFLGPDRMQKVDGCELYGMDICQDMPQEMRYENQQLAGSAYWVPEETFRTMIEAILKQLRRAGFRIVVAHGHGPSTGFFSKHAAEWKEKFGLETFVCWGGELDRQGMGIQVDHAAANETSLVMALRAELVQMHRLPEVSKGWPVGVAGKDPRIHAGAELGRKIIDLQTERMAKILRQALAKLSKEAPPD